MMVTKITCPECVHKPFRNESGLNWHFERMHSAKSGDKSRSNELESPEATLREEESKTSGEVPQRIHEIENRLVGIEGTVSELEAVQKHQLEEIQSRIASLNSTVNMSLQEMQRAIKSLETKQANTESEVRRLTRRLEKLEKELWDTLDSHLHRVVMLPDGREETKVIRHPITAADIQRLFQKKA